MESVTTKLMEHEKEEAQKKREAFARAVEGIEKILINENLTLGDWSIIIEHFNKMSEKVVTSMPIAELKKRFNL